MLWAAKGAPYYSASITMHQDLGQLVRDAVLSGRVSVPDSDHPLYMKTLHVEVPQWLTDEVRRLVTLAQAAEEAGWNGQQEGDEP